MTKNEKTEALKFQIDLPAGVAKRFLEACEREDRNMASMARYIIRMHFDHLQQQEEFEEFRRIRRSESGKIPHFSGEKPDLEQGATG